MSATSPTPRMLDLETNSEFKDLIQNILYEGKATEKMANRYTSPEAMKLWAQAFTHQSYDPVNNYERFEFIGDRLINQIIAQWVFDTYPTMVNIEWLNNIESYLKQTKFFSRLAYNNGLYKFVRTSSEFYEAEIAPIPDHNNNDEYMKILEDLMESWIGCLYTIIHNLYKDDQISYYYIISVNIGFYLLEKEDFEITHELVFPKKSQLKELYDKLGLKDFWKRAFIYNDKTKEATVWFKGPDDKKSIIIGYSTGFLKKPIEEDAALQAIRYIKNRFKIKPRAPRPDKVKPPKKRHN